MPKVYIKFPKTGLGNMMLVWARGVVFARLNNLPYSTSSWWGLRWGALLRREQKKRLYWGYFTETSFFDQLILKFRSQFGNNIIDPPVQKLIVDNKTDLYIFNKVIVENNLFGQLQDHKDIIATELNKILTAQISNKLKNYKPPVIGIHIRRGDFKFGNPITTNVFFIKGIKLIRSVAGSNLPVTVFTDAKRNEIEDILLLPDVFIAEEKPDIVDILLLSKSKIMLLSQSSTFSYWGAFLSDAVVIRPYNDWQPVIKKDSDSSGYMEIMWNDKDDRSTDEMVNKLIKSSFKD